MPQIAIFFNFLYNKIGDKMEQKKFTMKDEAFLCNHCQKQVYPLKYSARDHCPFCLYSLHVDNNPGDRSCLCHGVLEPIGIVPFKNTYKIIYRCQKCGEMKKNMMARDDSMDEIIQLSTRG